MKKKGIVAVICLLIVGLLAVGCGGSSSGSEETTIAKAAFLKRAKTVCVRRKEKLREANEAIFFSNKTGKKDLVEALANETVPNLEAEIEELRELGTPSSGQAELATILAAMQDAAAELKANPEMLASGNKPFARIEKLSKAYGIANCPFRTVTS